VLRLRRAGRGRPKVVGAYREERDEIRFARRMLREQWSRLPGRIVRAIRTDLDETIRDARAELARARRERRDYRPMAEREARTHYETLAVLSHDVGEPRATVIIRETGALAASGIGPF
jgi:hypothetical protein